jgi:hypothetical protein
MSAPPSLDALPPEARFAIRGLAAGLTADDVAEVLRMGGDEGGGSAAGARLLRRVVRAAGGPPLTEASGDEALRRALAPALDAARTPPARRPGTACPSPDVLRALALGRLDGPLMLAEAEHAADCPVCMTGLVAARRSPEDPVPAGPSTPPPLVRWDLPLVVGALAGLAAVVGYLFVF